MPYTLCAINNGVFSSFIRISAMLVIRKVVGLIKEESVLEILKLSFRYRIISMLGLLNYNLTLRLLSLWLISFRSGLYIYAMFLWKIHLPDCPCQQCSETDPGYIRHQQPGRYFIYSGKSNNCCEYKKPKHSDFNSCPTRLLQIKKDDGPEKIEH